MHSQSCQQALETDGGSFWTESLKRYKLVYNKAEAHGMRNSQWTLIAPTGTIGLLMDCDTLGIEPEFSLMKVKNLAGGGVLKIENKSLKPTLEYLAYTEDQITEIMAHIHEHNSVAEAPFLKIDHKAVFRTASAGGNTSQTIPWDCHLKVMRAAQPFLSGAISKTVNLPEESGPDVIADVFKFAWKWGLKSIAVYREGSKGSQPLVSENLSDQINKASAHS